MVEGGEDLISLLPFLVAATEAAVVVVVDGVEGEGGTFFFETDAFFCFLDMVLRRLRS